MRNDKPLSRTIKSRARRGIKDLDAERHLSALRRVLEIRRHAEADFEKAVAATDAGRAMLAERKQVADLLSAAYKGIRDGKVSRADVMAQHGKRLRAFEAKYRPIAESAWLKVADRAPSPYQVYRALHDELPPAELELKILYFLGYVFLPPQTTHGADDTGSTQQALGGLPPFDASTSAFTFKTEDATSDAIGFSVAVASAGSGSLTTWSDVLAVGNVPGFSTALALVGTEFTFPAGLTQFNVSADIDWSVELSTWVVFGGAGCGAQLMIQAEPSDGSAPTIMYSSLRSRIAPALWGDSANDSGSSTITASLTTDSALQGMKVSAGIAVHAEEEGTLGESWASGRGTVKTITIHGD